MELLLFCCNICHEHYFILCIYNKQINIRIAYYDKLTGLPNHEYLFEHLDNEIKNMGNKRRPFPIELQKF